MSTLDYYYDKLLDDWLEAYYTDAENNWEEIEAFDSITYKEPVEV
jgi:hypothetical protein